MFLLVASGAKADEGSISSSVVHICMDMLTVVGGFCWAFDFTNQYL